VRLVLARDLNHQGGFRRSDFRHEQRLGPGAVQKDSDGVEQLIERREKAGEEKKKNEDQDEDQENVRQTIKTIRN
jgi:hypothetical protein